MDITETKEIAKVQKKLYPYQEIYIERILGALLHNERRDNLVFQLPTGGGKTVIFSEITRKYIEATGKKVLILTHRIELLKQTARALEEANVHCKLITSEIDSVEDQEGYMCFLAMVETLNNRLKEDEEFLKEIDLVIVDEAHYNSFRKIFKYFENTMIFGVTATPLSSNIHFPLRHNYKKLIVGDSINDLISNGFLSDAKTYTYDVHLGGLKVGIDGDYTVNSLDRIYMGFDMHQILLNAYNEKTKGKKTLIFNSSIATSKSVENFFKLHQIPIRHLDSTSNKQDRKEVLQWLKETPDAIVTSVGILTTGFDEPTVETIILNRATRSLTLYHQMIGRGSRRLPNKSEFTIIDLGNNAKRLGLWQDHIDWQDVFVNPDRFLEHLFDREQKMEKGLMYTLSQEIMDKFPNTEDFYFDIEKEYQKLYLKGQKTLQVLDISIQNHYERIKENCTNYLDAVELINILQDEIKYRLNVYINCLSKATKNYFNYLLEEYNTKLHKLLKENLPFSD
ncbi:MAG: DEAD/DEAH box helicase [Sphingobacteriales bacterium]|jgi:superfamily II DNA or RNA helicase|nr:MAG: DEAD/DEAH box helicase [Sphingobacteriales bacterium]